MGLACACVPVVSLNMHETSMSCLLSGYVYTLNRVIKSIHSDGGLRILQCDLTKHPERV